MILEVFSSLDDPMILLVRLCLEELCVLMGSTACGRGERTGEPAKESNKSEKSRKCTLWEKGERN